jgi:uncharacterized protein YegL
MSAMMRGSVLVGLLCAVVLGAAAVVREAAVVQAAPAMQSSPPEPCAVEGDKVVSPAKIRLGETAQIRLTLTPKCPGAVYRTTDIVLVFDASRSMQGTKFTEAKKAAKAFVDNTDLTLQQVGLVGFDGDPHLMIGLSQDAAAIKAAVDRINLGSGTNISGGIDMAYNDLLVPQGRPGALPVIVLISDGAPNRPGNGNEPSIAAVRSANFARLGGVALFGIGVGSDADPDLLKQIVGHDGEPFLFFSPNAEDLVAIYRAIALQVGDFVLQDLILDDDLAADITLVAGMANPAPTVAGKRLTWTAGLVPSAGLSWIYEIKPQRVGTYPTNDRALATFTDSDGEQRTFLFPQPVITVLDPEPKEGQACNRPDAWTLMVHSFPDTVGKGNAERPGCNILFDGGDWIEGTRYRLPDLTYELTDASGSKLLYRGKGVPGPGKVDQRLYFRVCEPPPYRLKLVTTDLNGYAVCSNSPSPREITARSFKTPSLKRTEIRFGFTRTPGGR